ncbi:hypothetical protein FSP39_016981 [Pinctada imbricata]|uniref:G-protein coupled receptors family 1 profile domain-containing protein n=1 Tax=Pinctada imbricata TaxID=66713 RepID=A0AA88YN40_PINIB|nr:hypothetical protein FSP39_016981 [Pinctada imbricata]
MTLNETNSIFRYDNDISKGFAIFIYTIIFVFALIGNVLVIVTLVQNKRMRTVTNVFLMNLAVSDLLLALFCMPFSVIPMLMKNFIFGAPVCFMVRYLQEKNTLPNDYTMFPATTEDMLKATVDETW